MTTTAMKDSLLWTSEDEIIDMDDFRDSIEEELSKKHYNLEEFAELVNDEYYGCYVDSDDFRYYDEDLEEAIEDEEGNYTNVRTTLTSNLMDIVEVDGRVIEISYIDEKRFYEYQYDYNYDLWEEEKAYLMELLHERIKTDYMYISAYKIDWLGRNGYKTIDMNQDDDDIFRDLFPDYDCTFELHEDDENGLYCIVYSHDVPMGSTWYLKGVENVEYKLDDILQDCNTIETLKNRILNELNVDINNWECKDMTEDYLYEEDIEDGKKVFVYGGGSLTLYIDNDNKIYDYEYDEYDFEKEYYAAVV